MPMIASVHKPVIFLACVNSYKNGKRLRHFVHERKAIAKLFPSFPRKSRFHAVQKGNISNQYFFDLLQRNNYHSRVAIMHFVGPVAGDHLRIESDKFEVGIHIDELSKLIGMLPNLQAVFLSGCATPSLVEMLIRRDVPAVLVTQSGDEKNLDAMAISRRFYRLLSQGYTIREAAAYVRKEHGQFGAHCLHYNVEDDSLEWRTDPNVRLPWGVYYLQDNESRLTKPTVLRPVIPFPINQDYKKANRIRKSIKALKYATAAVALSLLAVGISIYFHTPEQLVQIQQVLAFW